MGKSGEIGLAAWLSHFVHKALPVVFVKDSGGREAAQQFCGNLLTFNNKVDEALERLELIIVDAR